MPIVNLFYDGTGGQNRKLEVFLRTATSSAERASDGVFGDDRPVEGEALYPLTERPSEKVTRT